MSHPDDVVGIIYHMNFPYPTDPFYQHNPVDNEGRRAFYGIGSVPHVRVDGSQSGTSDAALLEAYNERKAVPTDLSLVIDGTWDSETRDVELTVTASTETPLAGSYRLHIALVENGIFFDGGNGVLWHEYTMLDMFPDFAGTAVNFTGDVPQTAEASASFTLPTGDAPHEYVAENCQIVCFLQEVSSDRSPGEVHQAAAEYVTDLGQTGAPVLPARLALEPSYPNPFNPRTAIPVSVKEDGAARLEILDASGRRVRVLHDGPLSAGTRDFVWDGRGERGEALASGVYLARLSGATEIHAQRLVLIK